ncbi:uncharacterized protein LOC128092446 [Culex pipiens pallens]|uniref:uncharacterized protein LOC128092446 n=1 Tax=Culex pipiens pallens TaxID=42434 RepID=UPI0022AA6470|nr:uncharacterized protein LOC128092446 [Culex pipiens pallens]
MSRLIGIFTLFLAVIASTILANELEKHCSKISCRIYTDKYCTKPLKTGSYCWCQSLQRSIVKRLMTCPAGQVFNGNSEKCEKDSPGARSFCETCGDKCKFY